jgi:hypothetical protein
MTQDRITMVAWLALLLIPGAVFATGFLTWWRRRG